jgi:hypothetical protein
MFLPLFRTNTIATKACSSRPIKGRLPVLNISQFCSKLVAAVIAISLYFESTILAADMKIVGTWRLVSMKSRNSLTSVETNTWGDNPMGLITYTPDGYMSAILAKSDRKISTDSAGSATDEEQAMLFRNSFAYAGRYTLTREGVIHHVAVAADPTWIGKDQIRFAKIEGDYLIISSPPIKSVASMDPLEYFVIWKRAD